MAEVNKMPNECNGTYYRVNGTAVLVAKPAKRLSESFTFRIRYVLSAMIGTLKFYKPRTELWICMYGGLEYGHLLMGVHG